MRFLLGGLLVFFLSISCYDMERDCKSFRTGTFEFETFIDGELLKTTFVRNDSIEIDYFEGKSDTASIRWINDCEYVLKNINPKNQAEKKAIHIKILETSGEEYTFEFKEVGKTTASKGKARRVAD